MNLQELFEKHSHQVYRLALHYVRNREDAEEITQDVFVTIHEKQKEFRGDSEIGTWIHRITINKCLDFLKFKKRKKRFAQIVTIFTGNDLKKDIPHFDHPGIALESAEEMKFIFSAIDRLPQQQKTAIILMKLENLNQQEVAEIMKISPKAVESLISRGKLKLRDILTKEKEN